MRHGLVWPDEVRKMSSMGLVPSMLHPPMFSKVIREVIVVVHVRRPMARAREMICVVEGGARPQDHHGSRGCRK